MCPAIPIPAAPTSLLSKVSRCSPLRGQLCTSSMTSRLSGNSGTRLRSLCVAPSGPLLLGGRSGRARRTRQVSRLRFVSGNAPARLVSGPASGSGTSRATTATRRKEQSRRSTSASWPHQSSGARDSSWVADCEQHEITADPPDFFQSCRSPVSQFEPHAARMLRGLREDDRVALSRASGVRITDLEWELGHWQSLCGTAASRQKQ